MKCKTLGWMTFYGDSWTLVSEPKENEYRIYRNRMMGKAFGSPDKRWLLQSRNHWNNAQH
ncbi:MAG: hypothetical protein IPJ55_15975 [Chloracidobacterium sp.]|nr:hypothetical protein [Chloracidobacterium sp.]